jgi:hypothetical protein
MTMDKLKPCPFCGEQPTISYDAAGKWFYIECLNDDCPMCVQGVWHTDMEAATKEWNKRYSNVQ